MTQSLVSLPPYRVRVSRRAQRARIQVSPMGDVEVVVPQDFNTALIPSFLDSHRQWLDQVLARTKALRHPMLDEPVPSSIELTATGQVFTLFYRQGERCRVKQQGEALEVYLSAEAELHKVLQRWLARAARKHLADIARQVASDTGLGFGKLSIRGQRSRWGSCSSKKDISLNRSLMFLDSDLVRYVILHELCHTMHMNHSADFWSLVAQFEPGYKQMDFQLRNGWHSVPRWAVS